MKNKKTPKAKKAPQITNKTQKYVLTRFINGQWLPLGEEDFKTLETECPEIAKIIKDPSHLSKVALPSVPKTTLLYDHWEKHALKTMQHLFKAEGSWIFHSPVDAKAWNILDYHQIVKNPMDFTTIKGKLKDNKYLNVDEFKADVNRVFDNCILYNGQANQFSILAEKLRREFGEQFQV